MRTTNSGQKRDNVKLELHRGIWVRPQTYDKFIVDEMRVYNALQVEKLKVLDIGGNIGAFARHAIERGAARVISVEPDAENFRLLEKNVKSLENVFAIRAAVTHVPMEHITLYVNDRVNKATHSTVKVRGRREVNVPATMFGKLLTDFKPDAVKIDVEGYEYELLRTVIPKYVKHLAVEWHLTRKGDRERARVEHQRLQGAGFTCVSGPTFVTGAWTQLGIYSR